MNAGQCGCSSSAVNEYNNSTICTFCNSSTEGRFNVSSNETVCGVLPVANSNATVV